jgi:SNF2 family DNA or RNA helicase
VGDTDAAADLRELAKECDCEDGNVAKGSNSEIRQKSEYKDWVKLEEKTKEQKLEKAWALRELTHDLRRLVKEFIGRYRSRRYFEVIRNIQTGSDDIDPKTVGILSCCGHQGAYPEVVAKADEQLCVAAGCNAPVRPTHVVRADTLGNETDSGRFGAKLELLVALIKKVPETERILVFVQFTDLLDKVLEALEENGLPTARLVGASKQRRLVWPSSSLSSCRAKHDSLLSI